MIFATTVDGRRKSTAPDSRSASTWLPRRSVVYRSDLIELIQYSPQTPETYAVPLLFCPPWINKFYIMDLAPGKSLIDWAVQHGHTCFAISYRNPDKSMSELGFRDYLFQGPLDAVRSFVTSPVHPQLTRCLCAWVERSPHWGWPTTRHEVTTPSSPRHSSIRIPISPSRACSARSPMATVRDLRSRCGRRVSLTRPMARTFSALRSNDLVFQYVANNWLQGNKPPSFDLLAWNEDSTRMPARMHSEYLRSCYLRNEFAW